MRKEDPTDPLKSSGGKAPVFCLRHFPVGLSSWKKALVEVLILRDPLRWLNIITIILICICSTDISSHF